MKNIYILVLIQTGFWLSSLINPINEIQKIGLILTVIMIILMTITFIKKLVVIKGKK
ncbi:hypothetical protein [Clostridium botulinum]|uniref:hypothetical protein n=1 Tax=Clostridium botulinum TaxID=1491 RepID=UPI000A9DBFB6|nr:hypothetical protein [Clostridium botulinum]